MIVMGSSLLENKTINWPGFLGSILCNALQYIV